ncbi:MAG: bifunctional 5,10-methylenetetrahydrofolate dehydrogenase/5,10-methenyltetrahydrofolate cyclohydrolase [Candidatus Paceibacterota bacterium]|jgi:methylenetetrahydrofolate dehydrogenase (NADP+)/methenyltetrahydrofolate cyclohydrolase
MIIDGNKIAKALEDKLATELLFSSRKKVYFVVFGGNAATEQFVKMKMRVAERMGIIAEIKRFPEVISTEVAVRIVKALSKEDCDGIVVQLPLTAGLDTQTVLDAIAPTKDIDVLGTVAKTSYASGKINRTPPVAQAIFEILQYANVEPKGKNIVVVGKGRLVGEPIKLMLERMLLKCNVVDSKTSDNEKQSLLKNADIIISGAGIPHSIKPEMVKEGVILIDAGTSEQAGKLVGDIDPVCESKASFITPVPGGVGPITIVSVLRNLL